MQLPPSPSTPSPSRIVLAAIAAAAVAAVGVSMQGPHAGQVLLMPLLVGCGGWLCGRMMSGVGEATAAALFGLMLSAPAGTLGLWVRVIAEDSAHTVDPVSPAHGFLTVARRAADETAPVLLAGAVACALLWGRRGAVGAGILAGGAAGATAGRAGLVASLEAISVGDFDAAALWCALVPVAGMAVVPGLLVGAWLQPARHRPASVLLAGTTAAIAIFAATPPLVQAERGMRVGPATIHGVLLPTGSLGSSVAGEAVSIDTLRDQIATFAQSELPPWPCAGSARKWLLRPRLTAPVGLAATGGLAELDAAINSLEGAHTHRLALVGRARTSPGPLGPWLSWPAALLLLDRPPAETHWARIGADGLMWEGSPPQAGSHAACAVIPLDGVTIQQVYDIARGLQDGRAGATCGGLAVVPPRWRPTNPATPLSSLSCPPAGASDTFSAGSERALHP